MKKYLLLLKSNNRVEVETLHKKPTKEYLTGRINCFMWDETSYDFTEDDVDDCEFSLFELLPLNFRAEAVEGDYNADEDDRIEIRFNKSKKSLGANTFIVTDNCDFAEVLYIDSKDELAEYLMRVIEDHGCLDYIYAVKHLTDLDMDVETSVRIKNYK